MPFLLYSVCFLRLFAIFWSSFVAHVMLQASFVAEG